MSKEFRFFVYLLERYAEHLDEVSAWSRYCSGNVSPIASLWTTSRSLARDFPRFSICLTLFLKRVVVLTVYFMRIEIPQVFLDRCNTAHWGHWRLHSPL